MVNNFKEVFTKMEDLKNHIKIAYYTVQNEISLAHECLTGKKYSLYQHEEKDLNILKSYFDNGYSHNCQMRFCNNNL